MVFGDLLDEGGAEALPYRCCVVLPDKRAETEPARPSFEGSVRRSSRPRSHPLSRVSPRAERSERGTRVTRVPLLVHLSSTLEARERFVVDVPPREPGVLAPRPSRRPRPSFPHPPREGQRFPDSQGCFPPYDRQHYARFRAIALTAVAAPGTRRCRVRPLSRCSDEVVSIAREGRRLCCTLSVCPALTSQASQKRLGDRQIGRAHV